MDRDIVYWIRSTSRGSYTNPLHSLRADWTCSLWSCAVWSIIIDRDPPIVASKLPNNFGNWSRYLFGNERRLKNIVYSRYREKSGNTHRCRYCYFLRDFPTPRTNLKSNFIGCNCVTRNNPKSEEVVESLFETKPINGAIAFVALFLLLDECLCGNLICSYLLL